MTEWNNPYPKDQGGKNILYSAFDKRPKHLDPVRAYSANEYSILGHIYEAPLQYHYLKRPYQLALLTASKMPEVEYLDEMGNPISNGNDEGNVAFSRYTINIKQGIQFQPHPSFARDVNGKYRYMSLNENDLVGVNQISDFEFTGSRELTADDYIYQIKRMSHPKLSSPIQGVMSEYIVGMKDFAKTLSNAASELNSSDDWLDLRKYQLEGVKKIDRYTYSITIKGKYPQLKYWMAMPFFAPMPWEADKFYHQPGMRSRNLILDWYPVGTGAYYLSVNNPNRQMILKRNPNFRKVGYPHEGETSDRENGLLDDAGKNMPFIDEVIYSLEKESIPYWTKFLQGYYDTSSISADGFDQAIQFNAAGEAELTEAMKQKHIKLSTEIESSSFYMGFNMLDDMVGGTSERARLLRQAISIAINYEEYISIFRNGRGIAAQGVIPPGIFGYLEGEEGINPYVYEWNNGRAIRKPIQVAKSLLAKAGYPNGRDVKTGKPLLLHIDITGGGPEDKALFDWYIKQFKQIDLELVIRNTDYNRFQDKMREGNVQIFNIGWNADYPDPENFMFLLYGPNGKVKHHGENAANYNNPVYNKLFNQMKNMSDSPERLVIINKMVALLRHEAPWIWGFHPKKFVLYHDWYKNVKPNIMTHNTIMYKRIDPVLRQEKRRKWNHAVIWPVVILIIIGGLIIIPAYIMYRRKEYKTAKENK
jgi:ABC-type transport system substrate-binding protein